MGRMKWIGFFLWISIRRVFSFYFQISTPLLQINKVKIHNNNFVIYKSKENELFWLPDECPHMGSSLSKGWTKDKKIFCPYHGFGFKGSQEKLLQIGNDLYFSPWYDESHALTLPYYPPEHYHSDFVKTGGSIYIKKSQQIVTENVLDMLHISYVHSFGNSMRPFPKDITFQLINETSGRTVFHYEPFEWTISKKMGKVEHVIVENEYHLPSTTITRVKAGKIIKTVMTRATPISKNETLFFFRVYRNFWKSERLPFLTVFGDFVMDLLMKKTLQEDIDILKHVYDDRGIGNLTPYDITIQHYRKSQENFNI